MNKKHNSPYRTIRGYQIANHQQNKLTPAMEDYLEMAYKLCIENGYTRVGKLSELLNVRPSSASKMITKLVALGYLKYDPYESIILTEKGKTTGSYFVQRHNTLYHFFDLLGNIDPLKEVELIEHSLTFSTMTQISALLQFFVNNPDIKKQFDVFKKTKLHNPSLYDKQ